MEEKDKNVENAQNSNANFVGVESKEENKPVENAEDKIEQNSADLNDLLSEGFDELRKNTGKKFESVKAKKESVKDPKRRKGRYLTEKQADKILEENGLKPKEEVVKKTFAQTIVALSLFLVTVAYGVCVVLFWDYDYWAKVFDKFEYSFILHLVNIFRFLFKAIAFGFTSWLNALLYIIGPFVFSGLFAWLFHIANKGKKIFGDCGVAGMIPASVGMIASIVVGVSHNPTTSAMVCIVGYGMAIIASLTCVFSVLNTCANCSYYGTKKVVNTDYIEHYKTHYTPAGYSYDTYEVKDSNGKSLGTIEKKGDYHGSSSYTETYKQSVTDYECTHCGAKSQRKGIDWGA